MSDGQVSTGGSRSLTVTVMVQVAVLPAPDAVHVTVVVPTGKKDPEAGEQETVTPGQSVVTCGAG
jgi:hypothetical protein